MKKTLLLLLISISVLGQPNGNGNGNGHDNNNGNNGNGKDKDKDHPCPPNNPHCPKQVPIEGIWLLISAGAAFALYTIWKEKSNKKIQY